MSEPPRRSPVQVEALNPRIRLTRDQLRAAPSSLEQFADEWRRKASGE